MGNNHEFQFGFGDVINYDKKKNPIRPKTMGQVELVNTIYNNDITFVNGPAGTGKTMIATCLGVKGIDEGRFNHLVLTRPIVESGEELGFLPGSFEDKVAPYMKPLYEYLEMLKGKKEPKPDASLGVPVGMKPVSTYKKKVAKAEGKTLPDFTEIDDFYKKVEICPLAYMRGASYHRSFIILDEGQNTSPTQIKLLLTRLGDKSKVVICGDASQCDLKVGSGFRHAQEVLKGIRGIGFVTLTEKDIVRNKLIKDIIIAYDRSERKKNGVVMSNYDSENREYLNIHDPRDNQVDGSFAEDLDEGMNEK